MEKPNCLHYGEAADKVLEQDGSSAAELVVVAVDAIVLPPIAAGATGRRRRCYLPWIQFLCLYFLWVLPQLGEACFDASKNK